MFFYFLLPCVLLQLCMANNYSQLAVIGCNWQFMPKIAESTPRCNHTMDPAAFLKRATREPVLAPFLYRSFLRGFHVNSRQLHAAKTEHGFSALSPGTAIMRHVAKREWLQIQTINSVNKLHHIPAPQIQPVLHHTAASGQQPHSEKVASSHCMKNK